MRILFFLLSGVFLGIWMAWPGIIVTENWKCFSDILSKAVDEKISFKAALSVSPNYLLKGKKKNITSRIRIVSDACFR